jgi:ankyrin repeat protein
MLKEPGPIQSPPCLKIEVDQLEKLESDAVAPILDADLYLHRLQSLLQPYDSEMNPSPWKTLEQGSYYLRSAYRLVEVCEDNIRGLMDNENIQAVNNMLIALEFNPEHITTGYKDDDYNGQATCFVSKGQSSLYYKLLHSESKTDVRLFTEMVEITIHNALKGLLESIKRSVCFYKLYDAIVKNNPLEVENCVKKDVIVNLKDTDGRTSLHHAVDNGNIDIVNILLRNGADVTRVTNEGNTPLHIATYQGHGKVVEVLLQHVSRDKLNDYINARTTSGSTTSLHIAAKNGFLEIIKSLLKHGAIYNIANKGGKIPLDFSNDQNVINLLKFIDELFEDAKNGNGEITKKLKGITPDEFVAVTNTRNNQGNTLLQVAIVNGQKNIVGKLLETLEESDRIQPPCFDIEICILEMLETEAKLHIRTSEVALSNLQSMSEPDESEMNPSPWKTFDEGSYYLRSAYRLVEVCEDNIRGLMDNENIQTVNNMLTALEFNPEHITTGYKDDDYNGQATCFVSKGQSSLYYKLLHSESKTDVRLFTEMVEITIHNALKGLLESIKRSVCFYKLYDAIVKNNPLEVENCVKKDVIVNLKDTDGRTSLHHAVDNGNIDIVNILLRNGADVTRVTNEGNTPLHIATYQGHGKVVEALLQHVSRDELNDYINAKTTSGGTTSLHIAAKNGFLEIVKSLLKHGAIYNIENKSSRIPLDLSKDQGVNNLLKQVEEMFEDAKNGSSKITKKLRAVTPDEFLAVTNTRNNKGNTLLQVAIVNGQKNIVGKLLKMLEESDGIQLPCHDIQLGTLEMLETKTKQHIRASEEIFRNLQSMSQPDESEKNPSPSKTLRIGFFYLNKACRFIDACKDAIPPLIDNKYVKSVNTMLIALEFNPEHIITGYKDDDYNGQATCFVSKGQGSLYYKLLHSESKTDVRLFTEMVEITIHNAIKGLLESIKQSVLFDKLYDAIVDNNPLEVENYVKKDVIVNLKDTDGMTSLHHAVHNGNIDIVKILLKNGADVTQVTNQGKTTLHIATYQGHGKVVEVLLQHVSRDELNDYINAKITSGGTTSLHIAAKNGFLEIVKSLLKHGAIYNIENKSSRIPLDLSKDQNVNNLLKQVGELFEDAKNGNGEITNKLRAVTPDEFLAVTNTRNNKGNTLLQVAIVNGQKNIVGKLLEMLEESDGIQLPCLDIQFGTLEKLKIYEENYIRVSEVTLSNLQSMSQPDESEKNHSPWKTLEEGSHYLRSAYHLVEKCKYYIRDLMGNKNIQAVNNMMIALEFNPEHIIPRHRNEGYTGRRGKRIVFKRQGSLYYKLLHSVSKKDVRIFTEMVEITIDNALKKLLESIKQYVLFRKLHDAFVNCNPLEVENCIKKGLAVNLVVTDEVTSLYYAICDDNIDIVNILLNSGSDVTQITNAGLKPLHVATSESNGKVGEVSLQHVSWGELNDYINAKCTCGHTTSLHEAARHGYLDIIKFLLKYGATYNIENKERRIPLDFSNDQNVINLLKYIDELFEDAKNGNGEITKKLKGITPDEFVAVTNTHNNKGNTLLQVAIVNGQKNIVGKLLEMLEESDGIQLPCLDIQFGTLDMLETKAKQHIRASEEIFRNLQSMSQPDESEKNPCPSKTFRIGFSYISNVCRFTNACKDAIPSLIDNKYVRSVINMMIALEFNPEHIITKYRDDGYNERRRRRFVPKGQEPLFYKLLHSESKKDVRLFTEMVEITIHNAVKGLLESIKQCVLFNKLYDAIVDNNLLEVENCIKKGTDVNLVDTKRETALHFAVYFGNINIINTLLKSGAHVVRFNSDRLTPLHLAAFRDSWEIVEILLQHVSRDELYDYINAASSISDNTPLHMAAINGSLEIVKSLLKHGAIYNIKNEDGNIPLNESTDQNVTNLLKQVEELFEDAKNGNGEITKKLRAVTTDEFVAVTNTRNNKGNTLLQVAIVNGQKNIVGKLLEMLEESDGIQLPCLDIQFGTLDMLETKAKQHIRASEGIIRKLQNMSQPDESEKNPSPSKALRIGFSYLSNACRFIDACKDAIPRLIDNKYVKSVNNMLIALEFNPEHITTGYKDDDYNGQATCFVSKGQSSLYYKLLHSESKKDVRLFTEMVEITIHNAVKGLLESIKQSVLFNKLYDAIVDNNPLEVENYVKKDVIANLKDTDGMTSLHHAVHNGNIDIVKILLKNGADVTQVTNQGKTTLHIATYQGHGKVVEVLLQHVSRDELNDYINAKITSGGTTSLHIAAKNGFLEIVKSLLKHGAIYNIENKSSRIPLDLSKDQNVNNLLKQVGELFEDAKNGNGEITNKLRAVTPDEFLAVTNTRNNKGNTLLQVAIVNGQKNIVGKLLEMLEESDGIQLPCLDIQFGTLDMLETKTKQHIRASEEIFRNLQSMSQPDESEKNPSPSKSLRIGFSYLSNACRFIDACKDAIPRLIDNKYVKSVNNMMIALDFNPEHITTGYEDDAYNGKATCIVSKRQGTLYYKLLHSESKADVRLFTEMVEITIHNAVKGLLESIKQCVLFNKLYDAIVDNNLLEVENCIKKGTDVNLVDTKRETALHFAVYFGNINIINTLLKSGAHVVRFNSDRLTPLHLAAFRDSWEIVEILLQHVSRDELYDYINAASSISDNTPLHMAAINGSLEIVKSLLKHGAIYNIKNEDGNIPLNESTDQKVTNLLKQVEELFEDAKNGNGEITKKLKALTPDMFVAVTNTRNNEGRTLLQVAIVNGQKNIAGKLLKMLKNSDPI